jgi:hypothetical protein
MASEKKAIVLSKVQADVSLAGTDITALFERCLGLVRDDIRDSHYLAEALRVLPVGGYRSAIGSFWNAVVDDLRNKVLARSISLFSKTIAIGRDIKSYEDLQNYVTDDQLIDGAYKIGVIGWEASKMLRHAKETRHIFDGHPRSSEPSVIKVLAMMDDCIKYVLNAEYPSQIIDLDDYMTILGDQRFDRNEIGIENALADLPELYKTELANRLFTAYVDTRSSTVLRSNIEFAIPILWNVLPKDVKVQIARRVDQEIPKGHADGIEQAFAFVTKVDATPYLTANARKYKLAPLIHKLAEHLDEWQTENEIVRALAPFASVVPVDLIPEYVTALTLTYVGYTGSSGQYSRTDFYANGAAVVIPDMFQSFDDRAAAAFIECIRTNRLLQDRIKRPAKLRRLRAIANIVLERASRAFSDRSLLEALCDETREAAFWKAIGKVK